MALHLNGFKIAFSSPTFSAAVRSFPDPKQLKAFREPRQEEWFMHWRDGKLYGIPRVEHPKMHVGEETQLVCADHTHLHVLTARMNDCLPSGFPHIPADLVVTP